MSKENQTVVEHLKDMLADDLCRGEMTGYQEQALQNVIALLNGIDFNRLCELAEADKGGRCVVLPCKQYEAVFYILDGRVYIGWYLAKAGDTTHLILQDKIEMGICWVTDGFWFFTRAQAEDALAKEEQHEQTSETHN